MCDPRLVPERPQQLPERLCRLGVCQAALPNLPQLVVVLLNQRLCGPACSHRRYLWHMLSSHMEMLAIFMSLCRSWPGLQDLQIWELPGQRTHIFLTQASSCGMQALHLMGANVHACTWTPHP